MLNVACVRLQQILKVLHKTHADLKRRPVWNDLNPKAIDRDELFGFIHPASREWKDGKQNWFYKSPKLQIKAIQNSNQFPLNLNA